MSKSFLASAAIVLALTASAAAQTATTGALAGVVKDSTGAVVPGAAVVVTDTATGAVSRVKSDDAGHYLVSLLKPDTYSVSASSNGLSTDKVIITVNVSQQAVGDLTVTPTGSTATVEVSADTEPLIDTTTPAIVTTFNQEQIQTLPAPGGDITTLAFTAPGVVVNAGGSYGNFSSDGLPAISNLFVYNGFDDQDPFLNLNNSGSSNLTLGQGEIAEASVIQNGYTTQYGRAAGAITTYITKSGSNKLHGLADYYYNGDPLNANEWFRNNEGAARERAVSNEFALNLGGPITIPHVINGKDKLFFFVDYEFLHYVLPSSGTAVFPSSQFQTYILDTVPAQSKSLYQQAFGLYQAAPAYASAPAVTNGTGPLQDGSISLPGGGVTGTLGCGITGFGGQLQPNGTVAGGTPTGVPHQYFGSVGFTPGTTTVDPLGVAIPCATAQTGTGSNVNKEALIAGRVDYDINNHHKIFFRFKEDRGSQPTYTNFSAPIFNELSIQPSYEGQLNDTYSFSPNVVNQFIFASNWYTAFFGPANIGADVAAFPSYLEIADNGTNSGAFGNLGVPNAFPQGRDVTQYQFVDNLSITRGRNNLKVGYDFRRDDVSDYDAEENELGTYDFVTLGDFAAGALNGSTASNFTQQFNASGTAHLALYNVGVYFQDDWKITPTFTLSAGVRFDRTGNPLCTNNCFTRYNGAFPAANVSTATPYNQLLTNTHSSGFVSVEDVVTQPRVGFNYNPAGSPHTVIRGGAGIFADLYPSVLLDTEIQNFPNVYSSTVYTGVVGAGGTGSLVSNAAAQANSVFAGYRSGQNFNQISSALAAQGVTFTAPNLGGSVPNGTFQEPKYIEYNLQIEQQLGRNDAIIINYAGNFGYDLLFNDSKVNASQAGGTGTAIFAGLPANSPDPNFSEVNAITNFGHSNYNGIFTTFKHIDRHGITAEVTYSYSHALDNITSNPFEPYNSSSVTSSLLPNNVDTLNYSNGDNDVRNNLVFDGIWALPYKFNNAIVREIAGGWSVGAKSYYRSGEPFSLTNANEASVLGPSTGFSTIAAQEIAPVGTHNCAAKRYVSGVTGAVPCVNVADFATDALTYTPGTGETLQNSFGNVRRNSFYGPHYADTDISLYKIIVKKEGASFTLGANAFNAFNHPNFGQPSGNVSAPGSFGEVLNTISPPTSPYGSFQGAVISGRVVQVLGKIIF